MCKKGYETDTKPARAIAHIPLIRAKLRCGLVYKKTMCNGSC